MSGFVAIFNIDGTPIDQEVLERLIARLEYRGPDKQGARIDGSVGFGQTLLCITAEQVIAPCPPLTIDNVTIVGDVRLDARTELVDSLRAIGMPVTPATPDIELVLRSYLKWGENLPYHLLGQFACAIWDAQRGCMYAFRDHFGQQPVYYAHVKNTVIIGNEITVLRLHPLVSSNLDDQAIADFLLFGNLVWVDKTQTAFKQIRRLPGGHILSVTKAGDITVKRGWTLPINQPMLRYRTENEYLEHFRTLLQTAIKDRMCNDKMVVLMSGGLDSTSIAAVAQHLIETGKVNAKLTAVTTIYERIHPDQERYFAELAAQKIGIPIRFFLGDDYHISDPLPATAEPSEEYESGFYEDATRLVWSFGKVVLYGEGADSLLRYEALFDILRRFPPHQALSLYIWLWGYFGRRPPLIGLSAALNPRNWRRPSIERSYGYPNWINPDLEAALHLRERWEAAWLTNITSDHRLHALAYASLSAPDWTTSLEYLSLPKDIHLPFVTMPFLDLRVVSFILTLPPLPWFKKKYLIRQAMQDDLPLEVLQRAKTPLGLILSSLLKQPSSSWVDHWKAAPELHHYVRRERIPPVSGNVRPSEAYLNMRPLLLNNWIYQLNHN